MTNNRITWAILIVCAIAACAVARSQEPPKTICGTSPTSPQTELIHVSCIDYDELRRVIGSQFGFATGKATQIIVHAKYGHAVRITLWRDGKPTVKFEDLFKDPWGRFGALAQFQDADYTAIEVVVLARVP